jgi:hypothetical protein
LAFEDIMQTVRLTLLDGFVSDAPEFTAKLQHLSSVVPSLFTSLLPRDELAFEDDEVHLTVMSDDEHPDASVRVRIKAGVYKKMSFPTREGEMGPVFRMALINACRMDYNKHLLITTNSPLKWWKKVTFDDRYVTPHLTDILAALRIALLHAYSDKPHGTRRIMFQRGQFVTYHDNRLARLDHILTYEPLSGIFFPPMLTNAYS